LLGPDDPVLVGRSYFVDFGQVTPPLPERAENQRKERTRTKRTRTGATLAESHSMG